MLFSQQNQLRFFAQLILIRNFVRKLSIMGKKAFFIYTILSMLLCACGGDDGLKKSTETGIDEDDDNTTATINDDYTYQIPVIFHVIYSDKDDPLQYVSSTRLSNILDNVNEIYKGGIYGESQNINVKFFLATTDEKGNKLSTPGIEYIKWPGDYPIEPHEFMGDQSGNNKQYIWEPNEYLNVMVYNFAKKENSDGVVLGLSHLPYAVKSDSALVGLETVNRSNITKSMIDYPHSASINSLYINSESTRYTKADKGKSGYTYNSADINVTVAHELGHYLGLHHMYTESNGEPVDSCGDTDFCEDTPSYNRVEYSENLNYYINHTAKEELNLRDMCLRNDCTGKSFYSANIMDYSMGYGYKFSEDQKYRMRWVLYNSPLMPGPKKKGKTIQRRDKENTETIKLPMRIVEDKLRFR